MLATQMGLMTAATRFGGGNYIIPNGFGGINRVRVTYWAGGTLPALPWSELLLRVLKLLLLLL